jgi:autotransporter-associated beta strand protein
MLSVLTWTGQNSSYWNNAANWTGGGTGEVPGDDDTLKFAAGAFTSINDMPTSPEINTITISGAHAIYSWDYTGTPKSIIVKNKIECTIANATINGYLKLLGNVAISVGSTASITLTLNASISDYLGSANIEKTGTGKLVLNGANTYSGGTTISAGTLQIGNTSALGSDGLTMSGGTLDLNGNSPITVSSLSGSSGTITDTSSGSGTTLIVNNSSDYSFAASIQNGAYKTLALTKSGAGTLTLTGTSNSYSGMTTISGGTLSIASASNLGSDGLTLDGGTLKITSTITINKTTTINSGGGIFDVSASGTTVNYTSAIGGSGALTKKGVGTLSLSNTTNAYTGGTVIQAGILLISGDNALGNPPTSNQTNIIFSDNGTLKTNGNFTLDSHRGINIGNGKTATIDTQSNLITIAGVIGNTIGIGAVTKNGAGTLTLTGTNTYSGMTTINAGTLSVASASKLGADGLTFNGGILQFTGSDTVNKPTTINSGGGTFDISPGTTVTYSGVIGAGTGTGALTKTGAGTLILSGTNTYSGATQIIAGILSVTGTSNLGTDGLTFNGGTLQVTGSGEITINKTTTINSGGGTIDVSTGKTVTYSGVIGPGTGTGTLTKIGAGSLILTGANNYTGATIINAGILSVVDASNLGTDGLTFNGGTLQITGSEAITINKNTTINSGGGTFDIIAGTSVTYGGVISAGTGTGALTKSGSGTLTLSGTTANTYSGGTVINAGNIEFNTSSSLPGTGQITINSQGALIAAGAKSTAQAWINSGKILNASTGALALTADEDDIDLSTSPGYANLSLGAVGYVTYTGAITPGGNAYHLGGGGGTLDLRGTDAITDNGNTPRSLVVNGPGAVIISGDNNLTGLTTINGGGTLTLGDGYYAGSLAGDIAVYSGATLIFNNYSDNTFSGVISGQGSLIINNTLILTNDNTFLGGTTINYGTLQIGDGITYSGSLNGDIYINDNATLFFNKGYGCPMSSSGHISGNGETIISGALFQLHGTIDGNVTLINNGELYIYNTGCVYGFVTIDYGCYVDVNISSGIEKTLYVSAESEGLIEKTGEGILNAFIHVDAASESYCSITNEHGELNLDPGGAYLYGDIVTSDDANVIINVQGDYVVSYCNSISGDGDLTKNGNGTLYVYQLDVGGTITVNGGSLMYWMNDQWVQWA